MITSHIFDFVENFSIEAILAISEGIEEEKLFFGGWKKSRDDDVKESEPNPKKESNEFFKLTFCTNDKVLFSSRAFSASPDSDFLHYQ